MPDFGVPVTPIVRDSMTRSDDERTSTSCQRRAAASPGRRPAIAIASTIARS